MTIPNHIAIIPDGNRRWAKNRGLPSFVGHHTGAKTAQKIFDAAYEKGVSHLSFWCASVDNITKRSPDEINFLFKLFEEFFTKLLSSGELEKRHVRVRVLGFWQKYAPPSLQTVITKLEETTKTYTDRHLTFLLAYNGTDEVLHAVNRLLTEGPGTPIGPEEFKKHLLTHDLPPVDLVIRTASGEDTHNSNGFMMWDTANAQLYFSELLWPDFSPAELGRAIEIFAKAERRLGK